MAKTYGKLPHQIFRECSPVDYSFNLKVLIAGQKAEEIEAKKNAKQRG
jgi:hypothetical protein